MRQAVPVSLLVGLVCVLLAPAGERPPGHRLAKPVPVEVDGKPLVGEGRTLLFPFVGDLDGAAAKTCSSEQMRTGDYSSTETSAPKAARD